MTRLKKRREKYIGILIILVFLLLSINSTQSYEISDSKRDVLYFIDGEFQRTTKEHGNIDIVGIEIASEYALLDTREDPGDMVYKKYWLIILWDETVSVNNALSVNHTFCYYDEYDQIAETVTFNSSGHEITKTIGHHVSVGEGIRWETNFTYIPNPKNPVAIYANTSDYNVDYPEPGNRVEEHWYDFYPNDNHTFDIETIGFNLPKITVISLFVGMIIYTRRKRKK